MAYGIIRKVCISHCGPPMFLFYRHVIKSRPGELVDLHLSMIQKDLGNLGKQFCRKFVQGLLCSMVGWLQQPMQDCTQYVYQNVTNILDCRLSQDVSSILYKALKHAKTDSGSFDPPAWIKYALRWVDGACIVPANWSRSLKVFSPKPLCYSCTCTSFA